MDQNRTPAPIGESQTILIVDDDLHVLKFVSRMLASLGFTNVLQAASPKEALRIWSKERDNIELVVTDFVMPECTGDRMALKMLEEKPKLKILFISGNDPDALDSVIPLRSGENFLQKPFTVSDIKLSVENLAFPA